MMNLKEKEFCEFISSANDKFLPRRDSGMCGDDSFMPKATVMQLITGSGFWISVDVNGVKACLGSVRNETRRFATIDSAASFLRKLGVVCFRVVNLSFNPKE